MVAQINSPQIGAVRTIWQAKKYRDKKVRLSEVRELSGLVSKPDVTKGIIVTTSYLTRGAIDWVKKDTFRLAYKDKDDIESWVRKNL